MNLFYFLLGAFVSLAAWLSIESSSRTYFVFSRSARKFYSRMKTMFGNIYCDSINGSLEKAFCLQCADYVESRAKASEHGRKNTYRWYTESDNNFYRLVMTTAYQKLIFAPFRLYSDLDSDQVVGYSYIFNYAANKLIEIGQIDQEFLVQANLFLDKVKALCKGSVILK